MLGMSAKRDKGMTISTLDRKTHWEQVYAGKSPLEVSWYQKEPALSLTLIGNCRLGRGDPIIDVGGGASVLADHLLAAGFENLSVLDISESALAHARTRLGRQAKRVEWYEADITAFAPPHPYQLWHDRAVFHFLTDPEDRSKYVRILKRAVPFGGHVVLAAFALDGPEKCSGLPIVQYDAARLQDELGPEFQLMEEVSELHGTPAGDEQKFAYFRLTRISGGVPAY